MGSINEQFIVGVIFIGIYGSFFKYGLIFEGVEFFKIVFVNGEEVFCLLIERLDFFCVVLFSLGVIGIVIEVIFRVVKVFSLVWE